MTDRTLLWLALVAAIVSLAPLLIVAWGVSGGDGQPPNIVAGILGFAVLVSGFVSVVAAVRQLVDEPTNWTIAVMAAPVVLSILALLATGPRTWRGHPRSRLTAEDVRAMGLDPAEHGFATSHSRLPGAIMTLVGVAAPLAAPALSLATAQP